MFTIQCAGCGAETNMLLDDVTYNGPFRCWKCKGAFVIKIENKELKSCEAISEQEHEKYIE
jgi:hypothetical protein